MPNPLADNDAAAKFLDFYGSADMEKQIVNRLYTQGVRRQSMVRQKAEAEAAPIRPTVNRTPKEIQAFANRASAKELALRQRRLTELQHKHMLEINPRQNIVKKAFDTPKEQEAHVKHMYDKQMKRFNIAGKKEELYAPENGEKALERGFKPCVHPAVPQDGKQLLVHDGPAGPAVRPYQRSKSTLAGEDRERYYSRLAAPLHVWPKHETEDNVNGFCVYSKFRAPAKGDHLQ